MQKSQVSSKQDEPPAVTELDNLAQLVTSQEWIEALKVANFHKDYCQKEVNRFTRERDLIGAYGALMRLDDADKIFRLIKARLEELRKGKK